MPYCTPANLSQYMPSQVLAMYTLGQQEQACIDASNEADSYMRGRYLLPLSYWGADVTKYTAWIACYLLAQLMGYSTEAGADRQITERYYMAIGWPDRPGTGWFPGIQRQAIHPDVTPSVPSGPGATHSVPQVISDAPRGWRQTNYLRKPTVG